MRKLALIALFALSPAGAATADDARPVIAQQLQALMDATSNGDAAVWARLLDPSCLYVEEDDTIKSKADMVNEAVPLPRGISGTIHVELLRFHQEGDIATAVRRDHETENYFGQILHAEYLRTTTWRKRPKGWKLIAAQVLAEPIDPPAIALPPDMLPQYAGRYRLQDSNAIYTVAVTGGTLEGGRDGKPPAPLKAELRDIFYTPGQPRVRLVFQRDASGRVTGFYSRREGRDIVWVKERG